MKDLGFDEYGILENTSDIEDNNSIELVETSINAEKADDTIIT